MSEDKAVNVFSSTSPGHSVGFLQFSSKSGILTAATSDHSLIMFDTAHNNSKVRHISGFNDEVIDLCYAGPNEKFLVVASNSSEVRMSCIF
jgi:U3 small nucleolar RNA-associated protein 13